MRTVTKKVPMKTPAQTAFSDIRRRYSIIYADPPWMYNDGAQGKGAAFKYQLQDDEWLYNLPVESIAEDNAVLFLWATFPKMESALELIRRWGFTYKTLAFNWVKTTKNGKIFFGMGNWTRSNPEVCLLATRGKPKRVSAGISSVLMAPREEHSKKPDIVRDLIVQLCGNLSRIELFARQRVPGWHCWGNQVEVKL